MRKSSYLKPLGSLVVVTLGLTTILQHTNAAQAQQGVASSNSRSKAQRLVQLSLQCLDVAKNSALAEEGFIAATNADSTWATPYFYLGVLKERSKRWTDATAAYQKFLQCEPSSSRATLLKAQMLKFAGIKDGEAISGGDAMYRELMHDAGLAARAGAVSEAMALSERAKSLSPEGYEPYVLRAIMLRTAGRPQEALKALDAADKLATSDQKSKIEEIRAATQGDLDAGTKLREASALLSKSSFGAALPLLTELVKRPDANSATIRAYAYTAGALRQYPAASMLLRQKVANLSGETKQAAEEAIRQLESRSITNEIAVTKSSEAERATSRPTSAFPPLIEALRLDPTNAGYLTRFAQLARQTGKKQSALAAYRMSLNLQGNPADKAGYVLALKEDNNPSEAARVATILQTDAEAKGTQILTELAGAYVSLGLTNQAEPLLKKLIVQQPISARVHHLNGLVLFDAKQYVQAETEFRAAIVGDSKNSIVYADLAGALLRQGKKDLAKLQALEAIKRNLKDHWVFREILGKKS